MLVSAGYNPKIGKVFSKFYHIHSELFSFNVNSMFYLKTLLGRVCFSSYLESGTGFCTSIAFCFNVCMYFFIWVPLFVLIGSAVAQR